MAIKTDISWIDATINPWIGCTKISEECLNCYAEHQELRFGRAIWGPNNPRYRTSTSEDNIKAWNRKAAKTGEKKRVFMASLSDFFEDNVQLLQWREEWWDIVRECKNLQFYIAKRSDKIQKFLPMDFFSGSYSHVHLGASVGMKKSLVRLDHLRSIPEWGGIRWTSMEPLLESLGPVNFDKIAWAIVGGESTVSNDFRPMQKEWVYEIKDQCEKQNVVFFYKQDAARQGNHSEELDGVKYLSLPMVG